MNLQLANEGAKENATFGATNAHMYALKDFIKMSIHNQSFFAKSRSEQKELAMNTIQKYKNVQ